MTSETEEQLPEFECLPMRKVCKLPVLMGLESGYVLLYTPFRFTTKLLAFLVGYRYHRKVKAQTTRTKSNKAKV